MEITIKIILEPKLVKKTMEGFDMANAREVAAAGLSTTPGVEATTEPLPNTTESVRFSLAFNVLQNILLLSQ